MLAGISRLLIFAQILHANELFTISVLAMDLDRFAPNPRELYLSELRRETGRQALQFGAPTDRLECSVRELRAIQTELHQASRLQVYDGDQFFVEETRNSEVRFGEVPSPFQQVRDKFTIIEHCQRCQVRHQLEQGTKPISPMLSFIVGKPSL